MTGTNSSGFSAQAAPYQAAVETRLAQVFVDFDDP
jgi:hypothetical protein